MLIALVAVVALGVPLGVVASNRVRDDVRNVLEREARGIAILIEESVEGGQATPLKRLVRIAGEHEVQITAPGGTVERAGSPIEGPALHATTAVAGGGSVTVSAAATEADHDATEVWIVVCLVALGALGVAAGLALWQARRLSAPLEALAEASVNLGRAGFDVRAGRHGVPEVDALAAALARRAEQIAGLLERERAFSSNVAHQLRSPLTALSMRLEELAASDAPATRAEAEAALVQAERLARTIDDLLALARHGRAGEVRDMDVAMLVRDRVRSWQPIYRRSHRVLQLNEGAGHVCARATPGAVEQALDVLLENALLHGEGTVTAGTRLAASQVAISVADEGTRITDEARAGLFGGHSRGGGLGLPLAQTVIEGCGGRLLLTSSAPTVFELRLLPAPQLAAGA